MDVGFVGEEPGALEKRSRFVREEALGAGVGDGDDAGEADLLHLAPWRWRGARHEVVAASQEDGRFGEGRAARVARDDRGQNQLGEAGHVRGLLQRDSRIDGGDCSGSRC